MLQKLGWPTLVQRRDISKILKLYKTIYDLVHVDHGDVLIRNTNPTRGHSQRLSVGHKQNYGYHHKRVEFPT